MQNLYYIFVLFLFISCTKTTNTTVIPDNTDTVPVVKTDTTPVQFNFPYSNMPDSRNVTIYQVNIRVFTPGTFQAVSARLDSIKALGVNIIYLMPIFPVGQVNAFNSPYCVKDYNSVNSEFGTLDDLRNLVTLAHQKNMGVILDWVANHTSWDNSWIANKSWYLQDANRNIVSPPGMGWNDVAQLDYTNGTMRLVMIKAMKNWVFRANVDGFRCDYADGPPADFWKQAIDTLRNITTHKLLLLAESSNTNNFTAGFDYIFGFNFYGTLKSIFSNNTSVLSIDNLNTSEYSGATVHQQVVRYTSNHDVDGSDGTPLQLFGGRTGSMASFVVIAYMKSVPFIYTGQEVGTPVKLVFPFTGTKVDWSVNPDVTAEYKKILAFRNSSLAIRQGQLNSYSSADICAFTKQQGTEQVLVVANLRNSVVSYTLPAAIAGTNWSDGFNGVAVSLNTKLTMQPYSYLVLKK